MCLRNLPWTRTTGEGVFSWSNTPGSRLVLRNQLACQLIWNPRSETKKRTVS